MMSSVTRREFMVWVLGGTAAILRSPSWAADTAEPPSRQDVLVRLPDIRALVGERAEYDGYVFRGPVRIHVGTARLWAEEKADQQGHVVLKGEARGGGLGYSVRAAITSRLDRQSCLPRNFEMTQTGSERRYKRLLFEEDEIRYLKMKHCYDPDCRNPEHMVKRTEWWGPIPTGSQLVHCSGCKDIKHYVWKVRRTHEVKEPYLDMLAALFVSRGADFTEGSSFTVPVVQDHDRWLVTVRAVGRERVKVPAGRFDCVKVVLDPASADPDARAGRFEGLFGIHGSIQVWLDEATRVPVRILGVIPFGIDLNCEVVLKKRVPPPGARDVGGAPGAERS